MKSPSFDLEVVYDGETLRAVGTIDPGEPETGPTYDCGGTPGCSAYVEDCKFTYENGVEVEDPDGKILAAVEDDIMEQASQDAEDDACEAAEARADARNDQ